VAGIVLAKKRNGLFWLCVLVGMPLWLFGKSQPERPSQTTTPSISQHEVLAPAPKIDIPVPPVVAPRSTKQITARIPAEMQVAPTTKEFRFVFGAKVNVRTFPDTTSTKVTTLNQGTKVIVLKESGDWARIQIGETQGFVLKKYLLSKKLLTVTTSPPTLKKVAKPSVDVNAIVERIIANSIASYSGRCPCPYHTDRAGRSCGRRSAYSRPGGASVICFADDVTPEMIASFN
jgi:uncharacterized protein YraI